MKTIFRRGLPIKYSMAPGDGGVDKCFEMIATNPVLCHVESYKDNECLVSHTVKVGHNLIVQGGTLRMTKASKVYGTLKVLAGATLHLSGSLTVGYLTALGLSRSPGAQCLFEVYDGATLIIDHCALKGLYGAKIKIHKYAIVIFMSDESAFNVIAGSTTEVAGQLKAPEGTIAAIDKNWIDPLTLLTEINGDDAGTFNANYVFIDEEQEWDDATILVRGLI